MLPVNAHEEFFLGPVSRTHFVHLSSLFRSDTNMVKVRSGLGTKTTWLGSGKGPGLGSNECRRRAVVSRVTVRCFVDPVLHPDLLPLWTWCHRNTIARLFFSFAETSDAVTSHRDPFYFSLHCLAARRRQMSRLFVAAVLVVLRRYIRPTNRGRQHCRQPPESHDLRSVSPPGRRPNLVPGTRPQGGRRTAETGRETSGNGHAVCSDI